MSYSTDPHTPPSPAPAADPWDQFLRTRAALAVADLLYGAGRYGRARWDGAADWEQADELRVAAADVAREFRGWPAGRGLIDFLQACWARLAPPGVVMAVAVATASEYQDLIDAAGEFSADGDDYGLTTAAAASWDRSTDLFADHAARARKGK